MHGNRKRIICACARFQTFGARGCVTSVRCTAIAVLPWATECFLPARQKPTLPRHSPCVQLQTADRSAAAESVTASSTARAPVLISSQTRPRISYVMSAWKGDAAWDGGWPGEGRGLMSLPPELLAMILARVNLSDLATLSLVS